MTESRKQYIRYVAHEIRTPLNSACLGTKLLVDALMSIEEKDEFDEVNLVHDLLFSSSLFPVYIAFVTRC